MSLFTLYTLYVALHRSAISKDNSLGQVSQWIGKLIAPDDAAPLWRNEHWAIEEIHQDPN